MIMCNINCFYWPDVKVKGFKIIFLCYSLFEKISIFSESRKTNLERTPRRKKSEEDRDSKPSLGIQQMQQTDTEQKENKHAEY